MSSLESQYETGSSTPASVLTEAEIADVAGAATLLPAVYEELRGLARARLAELASGQTLQATALVHEAYLRLVGKELNWDGPRHFFFAAARAMHDILVER